MLLAVEKSLLPNVNPNAVQEFHLCIVGMEMIGEFDEPSTESTLEYHGTEAWRHRRAQDILNRSAVTQDKDVTCPKVLPSLPPSFPPFECLLLFHHSIGTTSGGDERSTSWFVDESIAERILIHGGTSTANAASWLFRYFAMNGTCTKEDGVNCTFSYETPAATLAPPNVAHGEASRASKNIDGKPLRR